MCKIKQNFKKLISVICVLALLVQTLIVSANDANKSEFQLAIENTTYTSTYADSETADLALATATKQVQAVISARTEANENTATFVVDNPVLSVNAKGGTYTFFVTVTLGDGSSSFTTDTLTMNVSARPEPLKVVFDDEETVNATKFFNCSEKSLVTEGDKTFIRVAQTSTARPLRYSEVVNQLGVSKIDFDKYPYVKISWKNNDVMGWNSAFLYWGTSSETENSYEFYAYGLNGQDTDWKEVLFDMRTGEYTFLKGSGTYGSSGTCTPNGSTPWSGEGYFSFTPSNSKGAFVGDIEYIAFFGSKAEAEVYPVEFGSLKNMLETAEYTATYAQAETVDVATSIVTPQVQAVIDEWTLDSGETATFTIKNGEISRSADGGTFKFDVAVTEANSSSYDVSLTMKIDARPEPLAVVFDDEETVNNAKFFNASEKNLVTEGDKTFIRVAQTSTARPLRYSEVVNQLGVSKIDFDKYPYVKISWKNNDVMGWNSAFLYWGTSSETENSYEFYPYQLNGSGTDWKEVLFDMRTGEYTFLKGSGTYGSSGTCNPNGTTPWSGEGYFSFTPSNTKGAFVGDIEYIAFFASKEEAEAYPSIKESMSILSSATFSCESDANFTEQKAHSEITEQIAALGLPAAYTLENGVYVAPTATATGSYSVDVVFTATSDKVTVTLQIAKTDRKAYFEELTIDTYRSGDEFSYPESKEIGYIFAGWYDVETQKPIADTVKTGKALAKFVDADVLKVKVQAGLVESSSGNVIPDDMASLRFITTVDDVDYREVAFMISLQAVEQEDGSYTYTEPGSTVKPENAGIVYERLYYVGMNSGDTMKDYVPSVFSSYSRYFKTYTLSDIPGTAYDTNIRVTPYWETLDGTTVYGQTRTITVNEVKAILAK